MRTPGSQLFRQSLTAAAVATLLVGCAEDTPLASEPDAIRSAQFTTALAAGDGAALATLRRVTAPYHNIDNAIADGYALLSECEVRPGHGEVGMLYANFEYVLDGVIDVERPEGLLYEPAENGPPKLVGVDLAVLYADWLAPTPPEFLGVTFQPEDEFGAWALHIWIWRHNPEGMFAEGNPNVSC